MFFKSNKKGKYIRFLLNLISPQKNCDVVVKGKAQRHL